MKRALIIHKLDNVVMPSEDLKKGDELCYELEGETIVIKALEDIPVYHKVATKNIKSSEKVIKYGCTIGIATTDIAEGSHIHTHNIISDESER